MPWTETAPMNERMRFVIDAERGLYSMRELCQRYGVSRKDWLQVARPVRQSLRLLYNEERPHQFLRGRPPASLHRSSPRSYTGRVPLFEYPGHYLVKRVTNAETIRLKTQLLFLANALKQHVVGLEEVGDGIWSIHF